MKGILALAISLISALSVQAADIDTVLIGNPGNAADNTGYGSVSYFYRMGRTEVTNAQYVAFLNAVAKTDPYELYNPLMGSTERGGIVRSGVPGNHSYAVKPDVPNVGVGNTDYSYSIKPVIDVSWFDAIRFANWLHNGQGTGDTETGAYTLEGGTPAPSNPSSITRNNSARWFLPSFDESYKSAFYNGDAGVYYDYPMGSDVVPTNNRPATDDGNSANFFNGSRATDSFDYPFTDVGAYTLSGSPYGTFDQGGSVWEWNESLIVGLYRGVGFGSWVSTSAELFAEQHGGGFPERSSSVIGFRVATVPEPSSIIFAVVIAFALMHVRFRATIAQDHFLACY